MTKYIPLNQSRYNPIEKKLELMGGHLEETIDGKVEVSEGDATVYGEMEVKSDGSYELLEENGLQFRSLNLQEKNALVNRVEKQWANSEKYNKREKIKEHVLENLPYYVIGGLAVYDIIKWLS